MNIFEIIVPEIKKQCLIFSSDKATNHRVLTDYEDFGIWMKI